MCTEVLVNRLGGLSLPRKSVVSLTDRPDMTLEVYREGKTPIQQQQQPFFLGGGGGGGGGGRGVFDYLLFLSFWLFIYLVVAKNLITDGLVAFP